MLGKTKTVIELNGKQYDAVTGNILHPKANSQSTSKANQLTGGHVDGFFRSPSAGHRQATKHHSASTGKHLAAHKPERTQTLMRRAVTKPMSAFASITSVSTISSGGSKVIASPFFGAVDHTRLERAQAIRKNRLVSRFSRPQFLKHTKALDVQAPPRTAAATERRHPATDPLMAALEKATSHQQKAPRRLRLHQRVAHRLGISSRALVISVVAVIAVLGSGWYAYQNIPKVTLKIASARAGFQASLPDYHPSGYALEGPIQYTPGQITMTYHSTLDTRQYQIVQQPSKWNSETLLNNVTSSHQPYQTYENNGKTVYISDGQATFMNGGVQTIIKGASLTGDQLAKIADSL